MEKSSSQIIACHLSMSPHPPFFLKECVCAEMLRLFLPGYKFCHIADFLLAVVLRVWEACTEKIFNYIVETKKPCEIWLGYLMEC